MANDKRLDGRVALVSGGLRGIGRGIVDAMLSDGGQVVITDLDAANSDIVKEALEANPLAHYIRLDATSEQAWQEARNAVKSKYGRLDVLVNNVGSDLTGKVQDLKLEDWRRLMTINVDSVFLGTKTFQPLLAQSGSKTPYGSSIINISSVMGIVGMGDVSAYNASKGAVRMFSKSNAVEFADNDVPIRVNSVHPGFVETPLLWAGMEKWAKRDGIKAQDLIDGVAEMTPIKRLGQPIEIGRVVAFLACDDSSFMTGSEVVVDGGFTAK